MEKYSAWSSEILNILRSHNHYIEGNWNQMYLHKNPTLRVHWRIIACMLNECKLAASGSSLLTSSLQPPVHGGIAISKRSLHLAHRAINNLSKSDHMQHNWAPCITHGEKKRTVGMDGRGQQQTGIERIIEGWRQTGPAPCTGDKASHVGCKITRWALFGFNLLCGT